MKKVKLSDTLAKGLQGILKRLESTEKFVLEQAPAVCKEIVTERAISAATSLVAFLVVESLGLYTIFSAIGMGRSSSEFWDRNTTTGLGYIIAGVGVIGLLCTLSELITLKLCPKLVLIRSVKDLLSTKKE